MCTSHGEKKREKNIIIEKKTTLSTAEEQKANTTVSPTDPSSVAYL